MLNRNQRAFTLIELLVVIAVLALLVGIIVPSLERVRELGRRAACQVNLKSIGTAANQYATQNGGIFPYMTEANSDNFTVGNFRTDPAGVSNGCTRPWFGLARSGLVRVEAFRCPSDFLVDTASYDPTAMYDFQTTATGTPLSYAFQVTKISAGAGFYLTLMDSAGMVIAADQNPLVTWKKPDTSLNSTSASAVVSVQATPTYPSGPTANSYGQFNSVNHEYDGQEVLRLDSSVTWADNPFCGVNQDEIWTKGGTSGAPGSGSTTGVPNSRTDSYLMP